MLGDTTQVGKGVVEIPGHQNRPKTKCQAGYQKQQDHLDGFRGYLVGVILGDDAERGQHACLDDGGLDFFVEQKRIDVFVNFKIALQINIVFLQSRNSAKTPFQSP